MSTYSACQGFPYRVVEWRSTTAFVQNPLMWYKECKNPLIFHTQWAKISKCLGKPMYMYVCKFRVHDSVSTDPWGCRVKGHHGHLVHLREKSMQLCEDSWGLPGWRNTRVRVSLQSASHPVLLFWCRYTCKFGMLFNICLFPAELFVGMRHASDSVMASCTL